MSTANEARSEVASNAPSPENVNGSPHVGYRDSMRSLVEYRKLPETARLVRLLAEKAGLGVANVTKDGGA